MFAIQHLLNILYLQLYQKKSNHNEDVIRNSVSKKVDIVQLTSAAITQSADIYYIDWKRPEEEMTLFINKENKLVIRRNNIEVRYI